MADTSKKSDPVDLTARNAWTIRDTDPRTVVFEKALISDGKTIPAGATRKFWRWGDILLRNDSGSPDEPSIVDVSDLTGHIESGGAHYAKESKRF